MIFPKSPINDEQEEKIFRIGFVVCQQLTLKSGAFGSRPRKEKPGNELRNVIRMT